MERLGFEYLRGIRHRREPFALYATRTNDLPSSKTHAKLLLLGHFDQSQEEHQGSPIR
jgi:hypothetical protein